MQETFAWLLKETGYDDNDDGYTQTYRQEHEQEHEQEVCITHFATLAVEENPYTVKVRQVTSQIMPCS